MKTSPNHPTLTSRLLFALCLLIIGVTLFRFWYATQLGLVGDEAYYWVCSKNLDWSFFDKGPGAATTIFLGTHLFGDTVLGIRFFAVLLSAGIGILLFLLARRLFGERAGFWSIILAMLIPLFAVGSILMTIDPLSIFFWTLAALFFWEAVQGIPREGKGSFFPNLLYWIGTGSAVGLGMLAKYTNLVELLCFALFFMLQKEKRFLLRTPQFFVMLGVTLLFSFPMVIWNYKHGGIGLIHLIRRGDLNHSWGIHPGEPLTFLGAQLGVISPFIFLGILLIVLAPFLQRFWKTSKQDLSQEHDQYDGCDLPGHEEANLYLRCLFIPLFLFYFILSLNKAAEPNWVAPCYISGIILLTGNWPAMKRRFPWMRSLLFWGLFVAAFETVMLHNTFWLHLSPPTKEISSSGKHSEAPTSSQNTPPSTLLGKAIRAYQQIGAVDPLDRTRGSESIAAQTLSFTKEHHVDYIISDNYQTASLLSFYLPGHPKTYTTPASFIKDQYSIWPSYRDLFPEGSSGIFVYQWRYPPDDLRAEFDEVVYLGEAPSTTLSGRELHPYFYHWCHGLKKKAQDASSGKK